MMEPAPEARAVQRRERRSLIAALPLLIIPLLAYVVFAAEGADFGAARFDIRLPSGGTWQITLGAILLATGLGLLFFEMLKAAWTGGATVIDHALSMMIFVACLILSLIWDRAATSTFFLLVLMVMIDVIAASRSPSRRRDATTTSAHRDTVEGAPKVGSIDASFCQPSAEERLTLSSCRRHCYLIAL